MSFRNPFAALAVEDDAIQAIHEIITPAPVSPPIRRMPYGWRPPVKSIPVVPVVAAKDFPALGQQGRLAPAPVVGAWGKGIDTVRKAAALPQPVYKSTAKVAVVVSRQVSFLEDEEDEEDE